MKNLRMIIFLMIISTVCVLLLSGANLVYERASEVFNVRLFGVILNLFDIEAGEDQIKKVFTENFNTRIVGGKTYYISENKDKGVIVFKTQGPGLWSTIELVVGIYPDFENLYGIRVVSQAETPGLGGRIVEPEFQARFKNVEIKPSLRIVKFASGPNEVDAVTGASKTSKALEVIINKAIAEAEQAFKENVKEKK